MQATSRTARRFLILAALSSQTLLAAVSDPPDEGGYGLRRSYAGVHPSWAPAERPFRTGLVKLDPARDWQKPLAAGDHAGFAYEGGILVGSFDEDWAGAMQLSSHKPLWWVPAKGGLTAPPHLGNGYAVFAFRDGRLAKLNLSTGKMLWSAKLDSFASRAIARVGKRLLIVTASQALYCLDLQKGETQWIYDGGFPEGLTIRNTAAPTVHNDRVYYGLASGEVAAVELSSGQLIWRHSPGENGARFQDVVGELVVQDGRLLMTRYDGLIASFGLDNPKTPLSSWEEPKELSTITSSAYRQGKVYVGTNNGYLYAFNAKNGKKIWQTLVGASVSTITAGESQIFSASADGRITSLDAASGSMVWDDFLAGQILSAPLYVEKDLYFLTGHKVLYGYRI